ncbi:MAG: Rpn family recombination-promoting nuclease/putative transposase [Saprospiraceae bacterium]
MPVPLQKPHDEFFKEIFQQKAVAEAFFRHFLPKSVAEQLDLDQLQW